MRPLHLDGSFGLISSSAQKAALAIEIIEKHSRCRSSAPNVHLARRFAWLARQSAPAMRFRLRVLSRALPPLSSSRLGGENPSSIS